jgi:protein SCO1/2
MQPHRIHRTKHAAGLAVVAALVLLGCGSDGDSAEPTTPSVTTGTTTDDAGARELAGIVRDPAPVVDATTVPSLTEPGTDLVFRAEPGGFQSVYFGYTNCPDVCPTTMADWAVTMRRLPEDIAAQVSTVMVTVDPDRDNELLPGYVESFVADAVAAGTTDADRLAAAAEPFGVSYDVTTSDEGDIEVSHSGFLYLVDDQGRLVVTWPFGTSSSEMAADVEQLFAAQAAT